MKTGWFRAWGWMYRPVSWQGVLISLVTFLFCVQIFLVVDRQSHSVSDTLYGIFPYIVPALIILYWIASKTAAENPS